MRFATIDLDEVLNNIEEYAFAVVEGESGGYELMQQEELVDIIEEFIEEAIEHGELEYIFTLGIAGYIQDIIEEGEQYD